MGIVSPLPNTQALDQITKATGLGAFVVGGHTQGGGTQWGQNLNENAVTALVKGPAATLMSGITDLASALVAVEEYLLTMSLESLQMFKGIIPGTLDDDFIDVATSAATIVNHLGTQAVLLTVEAFTKFVEIITTLMTGGDITPLLVHFADGFPVVGDLANIFGDLRKLLGNPLGLGTGTPTLPNIADIPLLGGLLSGGLLDPSLLGNLPKQVQQIFEIIQGLIVTPIDTSVQAFKDWFGGITGRTSQLDPTGKLNASALLGELGTGSVPWAVPISSLVTAWGGTGGALTDLEAVAQNLPHEVVQGLLGGANVGNAIQNFVDAGTQALVNDASLINQSLASFNTQLNNAMRFLGFVTSGAAPAGSVAHIASDVDNTIKARAIQKAFNDNIDPTTDAVFKLKEVWQQNPLPVVSCTAGATVLGDITIRDGGDKNAITWYGYPAGGNFGSISDFRVNVYSVNKATNVRTKIHGSANLIGTVGTGSVPVFNSYNLPASIPNATGDRLTVEIAILGAGTYNLVGQTISPQIPFHSVYGLHGLTRASAAAPNTINPPGAGGSPLSYSRSIPWIGMSGTASATQYTPVTLTFYGSGTFDPSLYQWANYIDIVVCGPGGRGADGNAYWGGFAGHPGAWATATLPKSVWGAVITAVNITNGGTQSPSAVTVPGWGTVTAPGGANDAGVSGTNNMGQAPAGGPGDIVYKGVRYPGGAGGGSPQAGGSQPGGAGAGGNSPFTVGANVYGGPGAPGIVHIRIYQ